MKELDLGRILLKTSTVVQARQSNKQHPRRVMQSVPATINDAVAGMHNNLKQPTWLPDANMRLAHITVFRSGTDTFQTNLSYRASSIRHFCIRQSRLDPERKLTLSVPSEITSSIINNAPAGFYTARDPAHTREVLVGVWQQDEFRMCITSVLSQRFVYKRVRSS